MQQFHVVFALIQVLSLADTEKLEEGGAVSEEN